MWLFTEMWDDFVRSTVGARPLLPGQGSPGLGFPRGQGSPSSGLPPGQDSPRSRLSPRSGLPRVRSPSKSGFPWVRAAPGSGLPRVRPPSGSGLPRGHGSPGSGFPHIRAPPGSGLPLSQGSSGSRLSQIRAVLGQVSPGSGLTCCVPHGYTPHPHWVHLAWSAVRPVSGGPPQMKPRSGWRCHAAPAGGPWCRLPYPPPHPPSPQGIR